MWRSFPITTHARRGVARWLLALVPPFVALALQLALWPVLHPSVWVLFYPAVFMSAWIGGLWPAVFTSALCAVASLWLFVLPERSFIPPGQYFAAAVFFVSGVFFGVFQQRLRRARQRTASMNEELQRASQAIASLREQAPDAIFVADVGDRLIEVNDAGCRMLGYAREELLGKPLADLFPAGERSQLRERTREVTELRLQREDGTTLPVEVSARILADGRWQGFVRDVRPRKELERALRASHADLMRAQSVAGVGSWRLDVRHNELVWSDEEHRIFGVAPGTPMTYDAFLACVHPDDRALVDRAWTAALRGEPYDIEHRIVAGGATKWVREKAELEFDERGELIGGIGISHDITERKEHEAELRTAQERFELALRGADLGAWDWNLETGEVVLTPRWAEMRGYRPDEIPGHVDSWIGGIHPDDLRHVREVLQDYLRGRTPEYEVEHRVRTKSGDYIWILDRGKVFARNERGDPIRMAGTELDITSRKRAEEALRVARAKASGIIAISADAIISVDEEQRITLFNQGAERIFGYTAAEVIGAPLATLLPERFRDIHHENVRSFATGAAGARRMGHARPTVFGLRKSGEEFPADASISKMTVDGKTILTVSMRDISEQKRIEREQRLLAEVGAVFASTLEYEETLATIARLSVRELADFCMVDVVVDSGLERQHVQSRDPADAWICDLFGEITLDRSRPHLVGEALATRRSVLMEHVTPEMIRSFAQSDAHLRALRGMNPKSVIVVPLLAHGDLRGVLALISSTERRTYGASDVRFAEELAVRAALAIDNAQLYRVATQAIRARDEVVGIVAHDLRNPLGAIVMQASLLRPPAGRPERRAGRAREMIERAAGRMDRLINDLLDVNRIEAGRLPIEPGRVSATHLVSEAVDAQRTLAASASIELRSDVPPSLPEVWGDRDRILQVLQNLVSNAVKFTKPGGRITVGACPRRGEVVFRVEDTGAGIAPEALPHVFDRFWQAARAKRAGVGLGLTIVKGIVEAHGGRAWAESTLGRGSAFFFAIPTAPQAEESLPASALRGP